MKEGMKKKNLSQEELDKLLSQLLEGSVLEENGRRLARGSVSRVAGKFGVTTRTVFRIWRQAKKNFTTTGVYAITHNKKGVCGRKPVYDDEQLQQDALALPCNKRGTIRAVANGLGISTYTAHKKKQSGVLLSHTNAILPFLSEPNKLVRILYAANEVRNENGCLFFQAGWNDVHIDEKWFDISRVNQCYYLVPGEEPPKRFCKHKSHIIRVMFMSAVARPRFKIDESGQRICTFDGKIGIWPFVEKIRAQRSSVNRPAGTMETKIVSVNKEMYHRMLIDHIIPAIRQKWPAEDRRCVVNLQADNAPAHRKGKPTDEWMIEYESLVNDTSARVGIKSKEQPPNSPDTNTNDLGFFVSLQADAWSQTPATNIDELIANVLKAFQEYNPERLNHIWLTHGAIMNMILENHGCNNYKVPHLYKDGLVKNEALPTTIALTERAKELFLSLSNTEGEDP